MHYFAKVGSGLLLLVLLSCNKQGNSDGIPYVQVNIQLYTSDPTFFNLTTVGGWEYINGGSKGIIVYRNGIDEFKAFDRHCSYLPQESCSRVFIDSSNIMAVDTCCGSQFIITDGLVTNGPAVQGLKEYQTSYDGNRLLITN